MADEPDPSLVEYWPFADVLIAPLGTALPADVDSPWPAGWKRVGCLDGDAGFPEARNFEKSSQNAWGGILMRVTRKNFEFKKKFTAFEGRRKVVDDLVWPRKKAAAGVQGDVLGTPIPERVLIGFEGREGAKTKRIISHYQVEVELVGDAKDAESGVTAYEFEVQFFPDGLGDLILRQGGPDSPTLASLVIAPDTLAIDVGEIKRLVATATWSDASTRDVSSDAIWVSSSDAVASAVAGFVTGHAGGAVTVSAAFGTLDDTASVTVS
jgi:hypothetical protein